MGTLTGSILGGNWVTNVIGGICLTIDYIVYLAINLCYQLFEVVGKIEVFSTDSVAEISHKIYTIIGIVMLFVFAYNIILGIIDPDSINKGDKSVQNVVKNTVISVVLITLFPLICEYMQTFQNHVVEDKTITNLILGSTASDKSALSISTTIFTAFYHPLDENKSPVTLAECETSPEKAKLCPKYSELAGEAKNSLSGLWNLMHDSDFRYGIGDDTMEYLFPLSTIAGVVAAYLFLSFSLDLGVRAAKLGALKLVAPIPIFLRITKPKGGQFDKWLSEFIKTYLQVFERIIIISFAMLLISYVSSIDITKNLFTNNDPSVTEPSVFIKLLAIVVVILGILKFAKDAPKLLEDLFNVKIPAMRIKDKLNDNEYAKRAASLGGAAAGVIAKPIWNNGKAIVEGFKKDENGKRHISSVLRGVGRFATGTFRDIPGTIPSALNAGRRGWQNGNVSDWSQVQDAITTARVQNETDFNSLKNKANDKIDSIESAVKNPKGWVHDKIETLDNMINVSGISNEKLAAAKDMQSRFKTLFDAFTDVETENARKGALKDYQNGKSVKFRKDVTGTDGNLYTAGTSVPVTALDPKLINSHFEALQRETIEQKFKDKSYGQALKEQGKTICAQMEKTINTLGEDAKDAILTSNGINSIGELNEIFRRASEQKATINDVEILRKISDAVNKQVKVNNFASNVEKQKDKK